MSALHEATAANKRKNLVFFYQRCGNGQRQLAGFLCQPLATILYSSDKEMFA